MVLRFYILFSDGCRDVEIRSGVVSVVLELVIALIAKINVAPIALNVLEWFCKLDRHLLRTWNHVRVYFQFLH